MSTASPSPNEDVQRWTAKRKAAVVLDIIKGKTPPVEVARQHGLTVAEVERWRDDFITQGSEALRSHPRDHAAQFEAREQVKQTCGENFGGMNSTNSKRRE